MSGFRSKFVASAGIALAFGLLAAEPADARRGGSFGSRGMRTYQAPRPTQTAPRETAPVQRSMTSPTAPGQQPAAKPAPGAAAQAPAQPRRGGFLGGMGGGILGGLLVGGLIGGLMGHGFGGGMGGMATILMQLAIVGLGIWLLMKLFRGRQAQAPAMAGQGWPNAPSMRDAGFEPRGSGGGAVPFTPPAPQSQDIAVTGADRQAFERLLIEVQEAYAREDYAALRSRTTPEIMSYLAEELSQNALAGRRNDVSATKLLEADVGEAWSEDGLDYATAALRYESIEVMRDRQTGAVVEGDANATTQTTELWTFVREPGAAWKLSAIQEA